MAAENSRSRPAWLPLAAATILVPTVLAGLTLLWPRPQIEAELSRTAGEALTAAGFTGAGLTLNGRDATITGVPAADQRRAADAVQAVSGIRVAGFADAAPGTTPGSAPAGAGAAAVAAQPFGLTRRGEDIVLTGVVGSAEERATLLGAATAQAGGRAVVDELTITPGAPLPAGVDATTVGGAAGFLATAGAGAGDDLAVTFSADGVALTGSVADEAAKAAAEAAIAAALPGTTVADRLTVVPAATSAPTATPPPPAPGAAAGELDATAKQQLQTGIAQLLAGAPITFGPDSPQLTTAGSASVAKLVALVTPVTGARLQVDGFVAAGRGNGKLSAQELSTQRATTVRDLLVAGGVPADRILTRGLGEAGNPADRAAGRRVEITVI